MTLTDVYSRRFPYWWSRQETKEVLENFLVSAKKVYAKRVRISADTFDKLYYYDLSCSFDIEDTSFYQENEKQSTMYVWQFGVENVVIMGRTWDEFLELCNTIKKFTDNMDRVIIYIHFLDHEFQFMRKLFTWDSVFARKTRSPIYAITQGIEFRDSYILTGKSLAAVAKDITTNKGMKKRVGDLDYTLKRGCKTHLTRKEIGYCMADVQILNTYIREKIEEEGGNISRIPLTKTGYVRRHMRRKCYPTDKAHHKESAYYYLHIHDLTLEPSEYLLCKRAFQGGFTHANPLYVGDDLKGKMDGVDFTSSYPAVMLACPFPASKGKKVDPKSQKELDRYLHDYLSIFSIKFKNLRQKEDVFDAIISGSRCREVKNGVYSNGRIVSADELVTYMTNVDLTCVKRFYDYDFFNIGTIYVYKKAYLPRPIIETILDLYEAKTTLKGVKGAEKEYRRKKELLNSCYGMIVTDIVKPEVICDGSGEWIGEVQPDLSEAIEKYNDNKRRFLFYPWGVCHKLCTA